MGNALEFYDFLVYATFAVYIGRAFFPSGNAFASLLLSLATFGIGFLMRPLAGILIGAYADHAGRRRALLLSIGLMAMGTLAIVVSPPYAVIGPAAPVILVTARISQGMALGGEVGPSTAVLLEFASGGRRGALSSWQGASQGAAVFSAGLVGLALSAILSKDELGEWGWRIPFALGLTIIPVGFYLRSRLPETKEAVNSRRSVDVLRLVWSDHRKSVVHVVLVNMCTTVSCFVSLYMTTFGLTTLGMKPSQAMVGTLVSGAALGFGAIAGGVASDRFGRKPVMVTARVLVMLLIYPLLALVIEEKSVLAMVLMTGAVSLLTGINFAAALAATGETFPAEVRASALSIANALSVSVFGGTTQYIVAWLIGSTDNPMTPALYVMAISAVSLWAMSRLTETFRQ